MEDNKKRTRGEEKAVAVDEATKEVQKLVASGAYIPPFKLARLMQSSIT